MKICIFDVIINNQVDLFKIASALLLVGTDFILDRAVLAVPLLIDGNCNPTGLLMSSSLALALSLRTYGVSVLNIFIQWISRSSLFFRAIGNTLLLT